MKTIIYVEIIICIIYLLSITSCRQKSVVKEENLISEEYINIETNEENPISEEYVNIETNKVFTTEETVEISNKMKLLILPFENKANQTKYPNAKIVNTIMLSELYAFLYIVPSFEVPEKTEMAGMNSEFLSRDGISRQEIYSNYQADIIIFGNYILTGSKTDPTAQINLNIWNKASGKMNTHEYKTSIDADIFDTIDAMLSQIIKLTLNEEVKIAYLNIGNFKIGNGSYSLEINNKLAAKITNDNFSLNLKILPNAIYSVRLKNLSDNTIVFDTPLILKPGETTNITHSALGNIRCSINNKAPGENFKIFLDDKEIPLNEALSNLPAEREHIIKVIDRNKSGYTDSFHLSDREFKNLVLPKKKLILIDYSTNSYYYYYYHSTNSSIEMTAYTNFVTDGKKSVFADFNVPINTANKGGYSRVSLNFGYDKMDWSDMNTIKIWIYGTQTHKSYFVQLVAKRKEQYRYWLTDDWKGWKQISIRLNSFKFRKKDYPLFSLDFEMNSSERPSSTGNFRLIIGEMEVTRE